MTGLRRGWQALCLLAGLGTAVPVFAAQGTLVADAHVNSALPAVNSGAISNLNVGGGYTALLQFDLSVLPAGTTAAQVSRAVLRVYCNRVITAGLVSVQSVGASWGEYSVTYATLPVLASAVQVASVTQAGQFVAVDLTGLVQGWVAAPATNFGVALTAGTAVVQFDSKENDLTGHEAELEVTLVNQGPQGIQGLTGAAGSVGPAGATGPAGAVGATGATGPAGPAGSSVGGALGSYQGAYASTTNYAAGDVVVFQGSSYVSLLGGNNGNTPGASAGWWGVVAVGATGAVGPAGPTGATGPAGLTGPAGVAGPAGPAGAAGMAGVAGAPGLVYQGAYASTANYALGDVVVWSGASYASLIAGNHGNTPNSSPGQWGVLTAQGPTGPTGATGAVGPQGLGGPAGSVGPPGEQGPQGLQGIAGQAGAQGLAGVTGAQGLSGPMGPQGVAGPVGLSFTGAYSSSTNYGLADGVSYNGAGYVSLVASNLGNTPDQSPTRWALFAAAGEAGAVGPAGATGAQGLPGPAGAQGPEGATGVAGASGPQGPAVANYTGDYVSSTNYGLHDAVSFGGSTYVSLVAGNVGNTPGSSPSYWAVLVAQGPAGVAGIAGPAGAPGATGSAGAAGAAGPQGPPVTFIGGWLVGQSYAGGDAVSFGGSSYIALAANVGREPDLSPAYWGVLAQAGEVGPAGATGAQGLQGPTGFAGPQGVAGVAGVAGPVGPAGVAGAVGPAGSAGPTGATGATGGVGLVYRGAYASAVNYALGDAVTFGGASYISLAATNQGNVPDQSAAFWGLLAAQGAIGAVGPAGATGAAGLQGNMGAPGVQGLPGAAGAVGMTYRGGWASSTVYAVNDAALFEGTTYIALAGGAGLEPDLYPAAWAVLAQQGSVGPSGPSGPAASVTVGTVTTGLAGTAAVVMNSGTSSAAVLNFILPQGAAGTNGTGGSASGGGVGFASMYHAVSFSNVYYSVNNTNSSATEGAAVLTWVPAACTANSLTVFSQQANAITVTLRQGTPGNMADTAMECTVASGGTCAVTGNVAVAAGSFLDLSVSGANGTSAGVWVGVGCS